MKKEINYNWNKAIEKLYNNTPKQKTEKKLTKQDVINAILYFANLYNLKSYQDLIKSEPLPTIIKMIVYDMFLNEFNSYFANGKAYYNYKIILDYSKELHAKGYIEFK